MKRLQRVGVLLVLVTLGVTAGITLAGRPPAVTKAAELDSLTSVSEPSDRQPEHYQGSFLETTLEGMLESLNITVYPEDKVFAFPDPSLGLGSMIKVYRAQPVLLTDGSSQRLVRTWAKTVADFAVEQGLNVAEKDETQPVRSAELPVQDKPLIISVTRVTESELTVKTSIEYKTIYTDDPTLERGTNVTLVKGENGILSTTYLVTRKDGVETKRVKVSSERLKEPISMEIRRGTKVTVLGVGTATFCNTDGTYGRSCRSYMSAAHNSLPRGTRVRVTNVANGKSVVVTITDKGIQGSAIIDLSGDAFAQIGSISAGRITVRIEKE